MSKISFLFLAGAISIGGLTTAVAQNTSGETVTKVVQNPDGSYTVIEFPVGKEVLVSLTPDSTMVGGTGQVKVLRPSPVAKVWLDVSGMPANANTVYAYAVDPAGAVHLLGPVPVSNGVGKAEFSTSLDKFMVVLSPTANMTGIEATTPIYFRSNVPEGYSVVPMQRTAIDNVRAKTAGINSSYQVPMLGVPAFGDRTTEMNIDFSGELEGLKGKAYIDTGREGTTQIKMRFDDMKMAPKEKRFILWAAASTGEYTKLGQVVNTGDRQEAEIRSETALTDFGLFVTIEESDVTVPTSKTYSVFRKL